jgi:hypothetical protein
MSFGFNFTRLFETGAVTLSSEYIKCSPTICIVNRELAANNRVKTFCGHLFHQQCLIAHLENDTSCPVCKKELDNYTSGAERAARKLAKAAEELRKAAEEVKEAAAVMAEKGREKSRVKQEE